MSEITRAVICMPFYMAMDGEISQQQFYNRAQSLLADYDTLATRLAEAEAWLDEVATLCATAERRVAELEAGQESLILVRDDYKRQAGEYRKKWAELEARQGNAKVFWFVGDKGQEEGKRHCKASASDGSLAMFETEEDAKRCARKHSGTEAFRVEYFTAPQPAPGVVGLVEALKECAASLAWNAHGECRAIHDGPIMPSNMALEAARAALAAYTQAKEGV